MSWQHLDKAISTVQVLFIGSALPARSADNIHTSPIKLARMAQVGDQLDRGDNEIQILYFLERLQREAEEAGGKLHILNGNHETMNVAGRFTYATLPALASFYEWQAMHSWGANLKVWYGNFCNLPKSRCLFHCWFCLEKSGRVRSNC